MSVRYRVTSFYYSLFKIFFIHYLLNSNLIVIDPHASASITNRAGNTIAAYIRDRVSFDYPVAGGFMGLYLQQATLSARD